VITSWTPLLGFRLITLRSVCGTKYQSINQKMIPSNVSKNVLDLFSAANGNLHRLKKQYVSGTSGKENVEFLQEE
jgi:hypothetical protein